MLCAYGQGHIRALIHQNSVFHLKFPSKDEMKLIENCVSELAPDIGTYSTKENNLLEAY